MSARGRVERLSSRIWIGRDPGDRAISVSYSDDDGVWQVTLEDEIAECLDADLRGAIAEATESDPDESWLIALCDEIEHELNHCGPRRRREGVLVARPLKPPT